MHDIVTGAYLPHAFMGEVFILRRDGANIQIESPSYGKLSGSGSFFLTNMRFVFHCTSNAKPNNFVAYQIELADVINPQFEQPIFGSNYLKVESRPAVSTQRGDIFKLKFNEGGCGTFLAVLHELLSRVRVTTVSNATIQPAAPRAAQYTPSNVAYIDPSDVSVIYVQQPSAPPA